MRLCLYTALHVHIEGLVNVGQFDLEDVGCGERKGLKKS